MIAQGATATQNLINVILMKEGMAKKRVLAQASLMKRILAFMVDSIIVNIVVLFPFQGMLASAIPDGHSFIKTIELLSTDPLISSTFAVVVFVAGILSLMYFAILEKNLGQTPGKMLFRLHVKSDRNELSYWQAMVRSIFLLPISILMVLIIVDPIVMFFRRDHKRLLEILSKTSTLEEQNHG